MSNDSKRKAAALRKVAKVLRAWGELYDADSPEAREAALSSPEGCEAARTALDLATRHFRTIMAASNRWGCDKSASQAVHLLRECTAERGRTDLGKYWHWCYAFTQRRQPGERALPEELDRWADKFEKADNPVTAKQSGFLGVTDLAKMFHVPKEKMPTLHTRLARFRKKNSDDSIYVIAVEGAGSREARYLHAVQYVLPEIKDLTRPR
jgi:hypothetical protein